MDDELDYSKSVEDLIRELRQIERTFSDLDTSAMPELTKGMVRGILLGLRVAVNPPSPPSVEFLRIIATAYERKYGLEPEDTVKSAEYVAQAKADYEEMKKQPDWEERKKNWDKYRHWPSGLVE